MKGVKLWLCQFKEPDSKSSLVGRHAGSNQNMLNSKLWKLVIGGAYVYTLSLISLNWYYTKPGKDVL